MELKKIFFSVMLLPFLCCAVFFIYKGLVQHKLHPRAHKLFFNYLVFAFIIVELLLVTLHSLFPLKYDYLIKLLHIVTPAYLLLRWEKINFDKSRQEEYNLIKALEKKYGKDKAAVEKLKEIKDLENYLDKVDSEIYRVQKEYGKKYRINDPGVLFTLINDPKVPAADKEILESAYKVITEKKVKN
jgi:hypothetical protein